MEVLLIGRAAQGVGGGLLSGLAFALIRTALPETAWARATAVVSAMFGVGTIVGPTAGGAFAQLDAWRLAFASVAAAGVILAIAAPLTLPRSQRSVDLTRLPLTSMIILIVAIAALSITSVLPSAWVWVGVVSAAIVLVAFIAVDRRARVGVLPPLAYTRGSLKWALHERGCSAGLNPPASSSDRAM